jgi:hypothetical protein
MNITYTYEIINVDQAARCMEVVYSSEGRQTMHIGARLPFEGESLKAVIQMYAPVALWREQEVVVVAPEQGTSGTITETDPMPPTYAQLRAIAYREESDPIFFKWQRGEATEQEWLDKVAEIKARYPEDGSAPTSIGTIPVTEV